MSAENSTLNTEPLDARGRNVTLGVLAVLVLSIGGLLGRSQMEKQSRIDGLRSGSETLRAQSARRLMAGFTNDGHVAEQLQGERPSVRSAAVRALRTLALRESGDLALGKNCARLLVPFLKDSDQPVRDRAIQALQALGPQRSVEAAAAALGDTDALVKLGAQKVLEGFRHQSLGALLAFTGDGGKTSRLRTAHRIFAGNALVELAKKDERFKTVILFGERAVLSPTPAGAPPAEVVWGRLGLFLGESGPLVGDHTARYFGLVDYLDPANANEDDQNNAISVLDRIGDTRAVPFLIQRLPSPATRRSTIGALGRMADRRATADLVRLLPTDETNRVDIVIALGRIADPASTDALIQHGLGSVSQPVRLAAADSLRNIGIPAVRALLKAADERDPTDAGHYKPEGAVRSLAGIRTPEAVAGAIAGLRHPASNVREAAALALGDSGSPRAIAPLIAAFRDTNGRVSGFAARSLSSLGAAALRPLAAALDEPDMGYWASLALTYAGRSSAPVLLEVVRSGRPAGARAAAGLLGELGDSGAIAVLEAEMRRRVDPDFQFIASNTIQRLGGVVPSG